MEPAKNFEELQPIIQSADCCAALYQPVKGSPYLDKNIQFVGLSSGKFSTSLQHGVPVLVRQNSIMGELIGEYGAGVVIDFEAGEDLSCLEILSGFNNIHDSCHKLFAEKLSINNFSYVLLDQIARCKNVEGAGRNAVDLTAHKQDIILRFLENMGKRRVIKFILKGFFRDVFRCIKNAIKRLTYKK